MPFGQPPARPEMRTRWPARTDAGEALIVGPSLKVIAGLNAPPPAFHVARYRPGPRLGK